MVLFDSVIQILTLVDPDRLQPALGANLKAIGGVAGNDSLQVSLTTVDDDTVGSDMTCQCFSEEPLGRRHIALLAELELDCVPDTVDGAVEIHPLSADLDISLVDMPFPRHATIASVETLQQ